jgi:DNA-binding NtrC family response regulator
MDKPIILCVDDEQVILDSLKIQLKNAFQGNYSYETAESAAEAMEIIEELQCQDIPILVIVSDWLMPGTKGDEFLIKVHEKYPKIVKIMLTGQADDRAIERAKKQANLYECLAKPWNFGKLIEVIESGLKNYG